MDLKRRLANATHNVITKIMRGASESLDIPAIRRKYNATRGRVMEIRVGGHAYRNWMVLTDGGLLFVERPRRTTTWGDRVWHGDELLEIRDYPTCLDLVRGKSLRRDPKTKKDYWIDFPPDYAYWNGYLRTYGDMATNEALRFILEVWPQIAARIRTDLRL